MQFLKSVYLADRFLLISTGIVLLFFISYFIQDLFFIGMMFLISFVILIILDVILLYSTEQGVYANRLFTERFSNGDDNEVNLVVTNRYPFGIKLQVIDEIPFQFQIRYFEINSIINQSATKYFNYKLRPVQRGEYTFGCLNIYVSSFISIIRRRFIFNAEQAVAVYPSIIQMKKYRLMAASDRLVEVGIKKIRRVGHSLEFDQIKEYVQGDDYNTINWKATARRNQLMVNHYMDEKAQQVYSVIDMSRNMKMPFDELSLLDYAINSSLVISSICLLKGDKAGLITFNNNISSILPARRNSSQLQNILEMLYKQETGFLESDYEKLVSVVKTKIKQRSLLLFYTNFESINSLNRIIKYLKVLASSHLVIVIFFYNTGLNKVMNRKTKSVEDVYHKVIAEQFSFEKRLIVKELSRYGIQSILTEPKHLSVNTINKYLELKARGMI